MKQLLYVLGFISVINGMEYELINMDDGESEFLFENQQENFNYTKTLKGHNDYCIEDAVFDPTNSNKLFSLSCYALKIWDIKKSLCSKTISLKEDNFWAESLAIGSDGKRVAMGGKNKVLLYDVNNNKSKEVTLSDGYQFLDDHTVRGLAFVPDNNDVIVTCFDGNLTVGSSCMNVVTIMNVATETKNIIQDTIGWLRDMAVSPHDKKTIIIASMDNAYHRGLLSFYDIESSQKKAICFASSVRRIACNPKEEHTFATCAWQSQYITLWDIRTPKMIKNIKTGGYKCMENIGQDVTFLPDGKTIAVSSENRTQLYDISSGKCIQKLPNVYSVFHALNCCGRQDTGQHTWNISGTKASPDGKNLVTYSYDNTIKVWQKGNN